MRSWAFVGCIAAVSFLAGCQSQSGSSSHISLSELKDQVAEEQKLRSDEAAKRQEVREQMLAAQKKRTEERKAKAAALLEERKRKIEEIRAKYKIKAPSSKTASKKASEAESKKGGRYNALIAKYAAAEGVPIKLAHAVVFVESTYRANATGSVGEVGLMQIRPATARLMGYKGSSKGLYDPATNLKWGMKYLGKARQLAGGDTCGTILRYNAGHGAKRMNKISARYCGRVKKIMRS